VTKKNNVYLTKSAQEDIEHVFDYIADDSINNATYLITDLEEKICSLENFPKRNSLIPENEFFETDYRHLIYKNYRIIYRTVENSVYVLRIIHGAKLLKL